jgi:hypothetical protein
MNFTHAVMDNGDMIKKYRWSNKEAKWYQDTHKNIQVIKLTTAPKQNVFDLIKAEPLF